MSAYFTGSIIKMLREKKKYSQKQLAELLIVSDKSVSKWETGKGLPDISLIEPLAKTLGVSVAELLSGKYIEEHYISFFAYITLRGTQFLKLYPEQDAEASFRMLGNGFIYAYCN